MKTVKLHYSVNTMMQMKRINGEMVCMCLFVYVIFNLQNGQDNVEDKKPSFCFCILLSFTINGVATSSVGINFITHSLIQSFSHSFLHLIILPCNKYHSSKKSKPIMVMQESYVFAGGAGWQLYFCFFFFFLFLLKAFFFLFFFLYKT